MANKSRNNASEFQSEGYIILSSKVFQDIDGNGVPINEITGHDSIAMSVHRKMFIRGHYLIDINKNNNFINGKYSKSDTLGYEFYDFATQQFVSFETLSLDSKIIRKGSMADAGGGFSNTAQYDPWNGVDDSTWILNDTIINGKRQGVINFILTGITDSLYRELVKKTKFWVNYEVKNFPLQLSYILSKKLNNDFVYKMQQTSPDGKVLMVTSLEYQPAKLPDDLTKIFEKWSQIVKE